MEFKLMSIREFNEKYGLSINEEQDDNADFYECLLHEINNSDKVSYFSASFDHRDVIYDIEDEQPKLNLDLIQVDNVYLAVY